MAVPGWLLEGAPVAADRTQEPSPGLARATPGQLQGPLGMPGVGCGAIALAKPENCLGCSGAGPRAAGLQGASRIRSVEGGWKLRATGALAPSLRLADADELVKRIPNAPPPFSLILEQKDPLFLCVFQAPSRQ